MKRKRLKNKLKNILLTMAILFALAPMAQAQESLLGADFPEDIANTLVRERSESESVSYVETSNHRYFALAQGLSTIMSVEIDPSLTVRDFVIHDDIVYFCGTNAMAHAIIGWFKIQPFFDGVGPCYLYQNFAGIPPHIIRKFNGICIYDNNENIVIVSVGETNGGSACVLSLQGIAGSPSGWLCKVGESSEITERMLKVCVTDNYVVSAGTIFNDHDGVSLRVFRKYDMFAAGGPQDRYHRYSSDDNIPFLDYPLTNNDSSTLGLTHTRGDSVALMAEWRYRDPQNQHFSDGFLIHVYDINNTINQVNPFADWSAVVYQTAPNPTDREIVGLNYNSSLSLLHFAMRTPASNGQNLIGVTSVPPLLISCRSLSAVDIRSTADCPISLDCLSQGFGIANPHRLQTYRFPLGVNTSGCATTSIIRPDLSPKFREKNHFYPLIVRQYNVNFLKMNPSGPFEFPNEIDCQQ